jgi:amino acid adenylation domain-containing protein/thioester reductase-like protein
MLAILRTGASYTLIEDDRDTVGGLRRLAAASADLVLTSRERYNDSSDALDALVGRVETLDTLNGNNTSDRDILIETTVSAGGADAVAYVLYTSGSTGAPKGVAVTHRNIRHYVQSLLSRLHITEPLNYAHVSTLSADLGNTCLFLPLWTGGTIHLVADDVRKDAVSLMHYLHAASVDFLKITPSHWDALFRAMRGRREKDPLLRYLVLGGELLTSRLARDTLRSGLTRALVNHYGPTETTIGVIANMITNEAQLPSVDRRSVPIGFPLGDTMLLVHDREEGTYHTTGATGELYVGGPSVTAGYCGNPTATATAFRTDVIAGQRFYRTGDVAHITGEGEVTFLGRIDRQVKISGYRVDLDHVETVLAALPGIRDAACCHVQHHGQYQLSAAVVAEVTLTEAELLQKLRAQQPPYLVPHRIVTVDELPRTANGKTDLMQIRDLLASSTVTVKKHHDNDDPTVVEVQHLFGKYLGHDNFTIDDDFFRIGGNSIDAILVVSELQISGHAITANTFLQRCTVRGVAAQLKQSALVVNDGDMMHSDLTSTQFSEAQQWFFGHRFSNPDHWNQALLLQAVGEVSPSLLREAVCEVVKLHPLLRTTYRFTGGTWRAAADGAADQCFTVSRCTGSNEEHLASHLRATARRLHADIDLAQGRVFQVHLCKVPHYRDQILLIAHHLSVDAVSWRIIVADMIRAYGARTQGDQHCPPRPSSSFWSWVHNIADRPSPLGAHLRPVACDAATPCTSPTINTEQTAQTVWLAFSNEETSLLSARLPQDHGVSLHAAVLGAFLHVLAWHRDHRRFAVDVETHGRTTSREIDVSRVVGWFTAIHRVMLDVDDRDLYRTLRRIDTVLQELTERRPVADRSDFLPVDDGSLICFNYLGQFQFAHDDALQLEPSQFPIGPARGDANDRVHDYKLTARILAGHLVIDLSFSTERDRQDELVHLLHEAQTLLLRLAGSTAGPGLRSLVEPGSNTGLLCYVPRALVLNSPPRSRRHYRTVLLTGATGYLGAHLLHQLLATTQAHVYCLVRGRDGDTADQRLRALYQWYFPHDPLSAHESRYTVIPGNVSEIHLGTPSTVYRQLRSGIDAIYHLASDTRLFGRWESFYNTNVVSTQTVIQLATATRPKDLHYVSTLAVCGTKPHGDTALFGEDDLDIGQQFLNDYERTKYQAEALMRQHITQGNVGFVYRCGNITGHSRSGRFQHNANDNRFIQQLRALLTTGRAPSRLNDNLVLSPVDVVASGILTLSQQANLTSGTFHVDNEHATPYSWVLDTLRGLGFRLHPTDHDDIATLLAEQEADENPDIQLGYFWASRPPRNIRVDCSRTLRLLHEQGISFPVLDRRWLRKFLLHLVDQGTLQQWSRLPRIA